MNARIVRTDNFDRSGEQPGCDEKFVLFPMSEAAAKTIVGLLNLELDERGPDYYKVVAADYKLKEFRP